jgi:hypothetical protein
MNHSVWIAVTFVFFLLLFTGVGIYSATQKQNTISDYLLASRSATLSKSLKDYSLFLSKLSYKKTSNYGFTKTSSNLFFFNNSTQVTSPTSSRFSSF